MLGTFESKKIEEKTLDWWEKEEIYKEIKKKEPLDKVWRFIDGPPYTTGDVHMGTAWNKILKDYLIRYKRMRGYRVIDTPGYDTHGLPIEVLLEKKLGIKNKQEILEYGLDKFISKCRDFAESQIPVMNEQFKRLGCTFWNWKNPYITLKNTYIQGIWWTIKKAWENNLLYRFYKPQNCCPRCSTALAKHEYEYHEISDTAIYVKFQSAEDPKRYFLIWTTTPWTLVANMAIMANPNNEYVEMRVKDETWIMGIAATANLLQGKLGLLRGEEDGFEYGRKFKGKELEGQRYIHPLIQEVPIQKEMEKQQPKIHTIVLSEEYVQEGEGVGLVHMAPGHGPEDFEVGVANNFPIFNPVNMDGQYTHEGGIFENKSVHDSNEEIMEILEKKGTLVHKETIKHDYAHCWRCNSKLVYRASEQWFFKTSDLREKMLKQNEKIYWIPEQANKNFTLWLENLQDWCFSRQRFWGIPLSIWLCDRDECENIEVIGSAKELEERAGYCPEDLHKPWIDKVTWDCAKCGGTMTRVPDLADVWLDSGSVMWAGQQFFDGYEHYDSWVPADFILEGKDQIRGWFSSLFSSAMLSSDKRSYDACYMHGWSLAHGIKMSKSLGNALNPTDIIEGRIEILNENQKEQMRLEARELETSKFDKTKKSSNTKKRITKQKFICDDKRWSNVKGIETFRFFSVMTAQPAKDLNFDYKEYVDTYKVLNVFWNSYVFAEEKMNLNGFTYANSNFNYEDLDPADKWILSRTNTFVKELTQLFDKYLLPEIPAKLQDFILNDLSRWYITLIREKVELNSEDPLKIQTLAVLFYVLHRLLLVIAPVNPMLSEEIYQQMFKKELKLRGKKSIHLETWPKIDKKYIDEDLENQMELTRQIIDSIRSLKADNKIKLRWPTKALYILPKEEMPDLMFQELIKQMANVKEVKIIEKDRKSELLKKTELVQCTLILDLEDTEELQQERIIRDLMRTIQSLRKQNGFKTGEEITLQLVTTNDFALTAIHNLQDIIISKVSAGEFEIAMEISEDVHDSVQYEFNFCMNKSCYASIRENNIEKFKNGKNIQCGYCDNTVSEENLGVIHISFKKM